MSIIQKYFSKALGYEELTLWENISLSFYYNPIISFVRHKIRFVVRMCRWIPILYKDEDWDYSHLLTIIDFKLFQIQKCLEQDDIHLDIKQTLTKMKLIRGRLDRFRNPEKYIGDMPEWNWVDNMIPLENGFKRMPESPPEVREYLDKCMEFEKKNFDKFFESMRKYITALWS